MHAPAPVAVDERLPRPGVSAELLCLRCHVGLHYQRIERPKCQPHFFWCRRCGYPHCYTLPLVIRWSVNDRQPLFLYVPISSALART